MTGQIRQIHQDSGGIYGSPRIHAVLKREGHVGRKRVERLMRQAGLAWTSPRRSKGFTRRAPDADLAPELVQCDFTPLAPNQLWVTDLTMIPSLKGPLRLSAIRDAFSAESWPRRLLPARTQTWSSPRWSTRRPAAKSPPANSSTTPITARSIPLSISQHAWSERVFRHPWARSVTPTTVSLFVPDPARIG
ncbi:IS3 family transposase [Streptomyces pratens]|uniref:IS3 family transposase n=1 Tax=Streptomyces pratens TaxID=887456 RepID=A0ABW1M9Y6_9ACTN